MHPFPSRALTSTLLAAMFFFVSALKFFSLRSLNSPLAFWSQVTF